MSALPAVQLLVVVRTPDGQLLETRIDGIDVRIGRADDNQIVLKGWSISRQHALLALRADGVHLQDRNTLSGTLVNGKRVTEYGPLRPSDEIGIGNYSIFVLMQPSANAAAAKAANDARADAARGRAALHEVPKPASTPDLAKGAEAQRASSGAGQPSRAHAVPAAHGATVDASKPHGIVASDASASGNASHASTSPPVSAAPSAHGASPAGSPSAAPDEPEVDNTHRILHHEWKKRLHGDLIKQMDVRRTNIMTMSDEELRGATQTLLEIVLAAAVDLPAQLDRKRLADEVLAEAIGLGPLEPMLADETVTEIMVNACDEIFVERAGRIVKSEVNFTSDHAVISAIERIVAPIGRRIDESSPMVDARLKDGSRVNAVIPPLALKGPSITIRKFPKRRLYGEDMLRFGSLNEPMLAFLQLAVEQAKNVVISGGTGSGKTTLLNVLSNFIPNGDRIVTVEDAAELRLHQPNLVSLEARPANSEGKGAIMIRELVKNCLRMRPDRIVVGECRGGEALDMLQAMNTGHDGSMTTAHANSPRDLIARLEVMTLMAGMDLPVTAIREQIASAVDIVIQQTRFRCGSRKITHICEITGVESGRIQMQDIFVFKQTGFDENAKVRGYYTATGAIPEFIEELASCGITSIDLDVFKPKD